MIMLRVGIQEKPPLLQTYILPSGPIAAPLGPPSIFATTSLRPSGHTRVRRAPRISTSTTEPSGIATGPSGNSRSVARTRILDILKPPGCWLSLGSGIPTSVPRTQDLHAVMAKSLRLAKQTGLCARAMQLCTLLFHRHPDLEAAIAGQGIKILAVALEVRRIGRLEAGGRQPVIPDRVDRAADGRDMVAVGEHRVALLGDADAAIAARQFGII